MNFWGYRRPDGRVGVRNNVLVLPASVCAADTCRIVASQVKGTVTFHNQNGCSQVPCDMQLTMDTIAGIRSESEYLRHHHHFTGLRELPDGSGGKGHSGAHQQADAPVHHSGMRRYDRHGGAGGPSSQRNGAGGVFAAA